MIATFPPQEARPQPSLAPDVAPPSAGAEPPEPLDEYLYLTGRPTLRGFLRFARRQAHRPPPKGTLVDEWHAAATAVAALEKDEAGAADNPSIEDVPIDASTEPLLAEFLRDPRVRHSFNAVPTSVSFVNLDQLVVHQHHINLTHVRLLQAELGPAPDDTRVFRTALLHDHPHPPVRWARLRGNRYTFLSLSNDLRFLGALELRRNNLRGCTWHGDPRGIVGLSVGFGSNFLNAIHADNRLILNNGSHRAYALRSLGLTRVPCIVQHVSSRAALDLVASSAVTDRPEAFLRSPRPPMLRDYFNPKVHKVMPVRRRLRQITVSFEVEETYIPAP